MADVYLPRNRYLDLTGQRFGKLVVVRLVGRTRHKFLRWLCRCDCGNESVTVTGSLRSGNTTSCGCHKKSVLGAATKTHGQSGIRRTAEYRAWINLRKRCSNPDDKLYGGAGVTVCQRWEESFANFYADVGPRPSAAHSIDRIDGTKGYEPGNCRWATPTQQSRNTRKCLMIEFRGQRRCLSEWAESLGLKHSSLKKRLERWPLERALTDPRRDQGRRRHYEPFVFCG